MADADPVVVVPSTPPKSSTVAKTGAVTGVVAILTIIWQLVMPFLPAVGVPVATVSKIDKLVTVVESLASQVSDLQQKQNQSPTPIDKIAIHSVDPKVASLEEMVRNLADVVGRLNQPNKPTAVDTQPDKLNPTLVDVEALKQAIQKVKDLQQHLDDVRNVLDPAKLVDPAKPGKSCDSLDVSTILDRLQKLETKPTPTPPTVSSTAGYAEALAKEAEKANTSPAFLASELIDGVLRMAVDDGMPQATSDSIRAACPAIGAKPVRDLTPAEVAAIRGVK